MISRIEKKYKGNMSDSTKTDWIKKLMCEAFIYYISHKRVKIWTFFCGMRLVSTSFRDKLPESLSNREVWRIHLDLNWNIQRQHQKQKITHFLPIADLAADMAPVWHQMTRECKCFCTKAKYNNWRLDSLQQIISYCLF